MFQWEVGAVVWFVYFGLKSEVAIEGVVKTPGWLMMLG